MKNPFIVKEIADDAELRAAMNEVYLAPFDLTTGPLYRFAVFSTGCTRVTLIVAHRII